MQKKRTLLYNKKPFLSLLHIIITKTITKMTLKHFETNI